MIGYFVVLPITGTAIFFPCFRIMNLGFFEDPFLGLPSDYGNLDESIFTVFFHAKSEDVIIRPQLQLYTILTDCLHKPRTIISQSRLHIEGYVVHLKVIAPVSAFSVSEIDGEPRELCKYYFPELAYPFNLRLVVQRIANADSIVSRFCL